MKNHNSPSLKLIAQKVGVSVPTVSRVLMGKADQYRISKKTQELIRQVAEEINYKPNKLASSLRLKKTNTIGLLIPDISNPYFASVARTIENSARKFGYSLILCDSEENTELEIQSIELLESRMVDGFILCPVGQESAHLERLQTSSLPVVFVDRYFSNLKIPYVVSDNYNGAVDATNYLIEQGHTNIVCIQGLINTSPNIDRVRGFTDAIKSHNIQFNESMIVGDNFGESNGYIETKLLLKRPQPPTAIFAIGNLISLGALRALAEEKIKVPENISLISFDDQPYLSLLATPLTTIAQQNKEMGRIAAKFLIEEIQSYKRSNNAGIMLPTKLVIRNSVNTISKTIALKK